MYFKEKNACWFSIVITISRDNINYISMDEKNVYLENCIVLSLSPNHFIVLIQNIIILYIRKSVTRVIIC